jgi:hypothetical protein
MNQQYSICYGDLEAKNSTPCIVCECWCEGEELEEALAKDDFNVYALRYKSEIILCRSCHLEDVMGNQGDLLTIVSVRYEEAQAGIWLIDFAEATMCKDKYCSQCH